MVQLKLTCGRELPTSKSPELPTSLEESLIRVAFQVNSDPFRDDLRHA